MHTLRTNWLGRSRALLTTSFWLVVLHWTQIAAAQPKVPAAAAGAEDKQYVFEYSVVLMCLALGMVLICKPSGRQARVKMPDE